MKKKKDLLIITAIYLLAFVVGFLVSIPVDHVIWKFFIFDFIATIVTFLFSVILVNSSVYDAYWSLTPMVMSIWLFVYYEAFSGMQILFLIVFNIWSVRLTLNWVHVFTDFSYEDWRYRKFRDETPAFFWPIVNFWGIHMMPTLVVFAGMLPLFVIARDDIGVLSIPGMVVILLGVVLEYFADRTMHTFLEQGKSDAEQAPTTEEHYVEDAEELLDLDEDKPTNKGVCTVGLWRYSRHPNYLGEILVWLGVYLAMLPDAMDYWYYGVGFVAVAILFNVVSIPLMEKRQMRRREDYVNYKKETSRLLLMPARKRREQ